MRFHQSIGLLFIYFSIFSYGYALLSILYPWFGVNVYNLINDYSQGVLEVFDLYLIMLISFSFGWYLSKPNDANISIDRGYRKNNKYLGKHNPKISILFLFFLFILSIFMLFLTYQWGFILRDTYHPTDANYVYLSIYKIMTLILIIFTYLNSSLKYFSTCIALTVIVLISLSIGSRISIFYIGLILVLYTFFAEKVRIVNVMLLSLIAVYTLTFVQYSRGLEEQGILGIYRHMDFNDSLSGIPFSMFYAFGFNTFITAATISEYLPSAKLSDFFIMINPLPGFMTDWYSINTRMTISKAVPFNSVGFIFSFGSGFTVVFYLMLGLVVGWLDGCIQWVRIKSKIVSTFIWALLVIFVLLHFQFTLRSSLRYLYYAVSVVLLFYFFSKLRFRAR